MKVAVKTVSLYPDEWADVRRAARESGQRGNSAGIRAILAEWRRLRDMSDKEADNAADVER